MSGFKGEVMAYKLNILLFSISIIVLAALLLYGNPGEVYQHILQLDISTVATLILLTLTGFSLRFIRFNILLSRKYKTKILKLFPVFVFGISLANTTPGRLAEPVRALLIKRTLGIPVGYTLACIFLERLSDMLAIISFALLAFIAVKAELFIIPFFAVVLVILTVIIASQYKKMYFTLTGLINKFLLFFSKIIFRDQLEMLARKISNLLKYTYSELKLGKSFLLQILFGVFIWGLVYPSILYLSLQSLGAPTNFFSVVGIYNLSLIVGLASFLPGGLGGTEAAITILLSLAGVEYSVALAASIITRALSLWDVVLAGPICALFIKERKGKSS